MTTRRTRKTTGKKRQTVPQAFKVLRPELMHFLETWNTPADTPATWTPDKAALEHDMAIKVLEAVDGDPATLDAMMRSTGFKVWGWMSGLVLKLFFMGMAGNALALCERMLAVRNDDHLRFSRPLILARMGRADEALSRIGENLENDPANPFMLMMAGDAYQMMGDPRSAEPLYRRGIEACGGKPGADLGMGLAKDLGQRLEQLSRSTNADA